MTFDLDRDDLLNDRMSGTLFYLAGGGCLHVYPNIIISHLLAVSVSLVLMAYT